MKGIGMAKHLYQRKVESSDQAKYSILHMPWKSRALFRGLVGFRDTDGNTDDDGDDENYRYC